MAPEHFSQFDFFQNPSVAPGMYLGGHLVTIFLGGWGVGVGGQNFSAYGGRYVWTRVLNTLFLYLDPLTHGAGPRSKFWVPPGGPPYRPSLRLHWIGCLVVPEHFSKFIFFRHPSVAPGMGLGDHLVTIWVVDT